MLQRLKYILLRHWIISILGMVFLAIVIWLAYGLHRAAIKTKILRCLGNSCWLSFCTFCYYEHHGHLPPAYVSASDGTRMHSWRILVAVEDMVDIRHSYDFGEPWNNPNNAKVGEHRPIALACPSDPDTQENRRLTNYFVIEGAKTPFPGSSTRSFADGEKASENRSNTILIAEATGLGVEWIEPRDLNYDTMSFTMNDSRRPSISSHHPSGCNVVMADGSQQTLNPEISPEVLKAMLTIKESDWRPGPEKPDIP